MDFTDSTNPVEIAYFDRGPIHKDKLVLGGYWSTYWYNGKIYGALTAETAANVSAALDKADAQLNADATDAELAAELTAMIKDVDHEGLSKTVSAIAARL